MISASTHPGDRTNRTAQELIATLEDKRAHLTHKIASFGDITKAPPAIVRLYQNMRTELNSTLRRIDSLYEQMRKGAGE